MSELDLDGLASPPMANGEVVFDEPWQSRVFGMARALCEQGVFTWDELREQLIQQIGSATEQGDYQYFDHFLNALTMVLSNRQLVRTTELDKLSAQYAARPHGFDHSH